MIESITLSNVLPSVFRDDDSSVRSSQVWLTEMKFCRGTTYLVCAESGTGKSTLLSFIYGNRFDYSGTICFDGKNVRTMSAGDWSRIRCSALALLPQEMRLFPELTVMENIEIKNSLTHYKSIDEIRLMLQELEIDNKADQPVARLSLGQQQRVALVRTLCQPFDFILMDEPVSHLDARNNAIAARLVEREVMASGAGVIVTSVGYDMVLDQCVRITL